MPTVNKQQVAFVGIDPGAQGGVAVITAGNPTTCRMPSDEAGVVNLLRQIRYSLEVRVVVGVELVTGYVGGYGDQPGGNPGSGMFKLGRNVGAILASLASLGLEPEMISPGVWQRCVGISPRKKHGHEMIESKAEFKRRIKARAAEFFPGAPGITLLTCDALLIAEHLRRKHE